MEAVEQEIQRLDKDQARIEEILVQIFGELAVRQRERAFEFYCPGRKHMEFFTAGAEFPERLFAAGNRCGKSTAGAYEDACHLTGDYPAWWPGRRFSTPVEWTLIGNTARQLRSAAQTILFGAPGQWGTGLIPKERIVEIRTVHGVSGAIDYAVIKHGPTGLCSTIYLVSAEQGWQSIQGRKLHGVHLDEEPPKSVAMEIYTELSARLIDTNGILYTTATPQQGMTDFIGLYWESAGEEDEESEYAALKREGMKYRKLIRMDVAEAEHLTAEQVERFTALLQPHERDARLKGIPVLGQGLVWPLDERELRCEPFDVAQRHLKLIAGLDSGYANSYTGIVWMAYAPVDRTVYAWDCVKIRRQLVKDIAPMLKDRDYRTHTNIPVAWPRDITRTGPASGLIPVEEYRKCGVAMLPEPAQFADNRQHYVQPGLGLVWQYMAEGRFKVFDSPRMAPWFKEWMLFSYDEDGQVVKTRNRQNDLMDATRYGMVMLDRGFARAVGPGPRGKAPRMVMSTPYVQ